jgi:hypothetical protein
MSWQEYTPMAYSCQGEFTIWDENVIDLPNGWGIRCGGGVALVLAGLDSL